MRENEEDNLPSLQKQILLCLAEHGPQTRNEMKSKYLKSAYKNVLYSFESLLKKGLIQVVDQKAWRRQRFPLYWLRENGIMLSALNGADAIPLIENVKKLLSASDETDLLYCFIELCQIPMMRRFCKLSYMTSEFEGRVSLSQLSFLSELKPTSPESKRMIGVFRKYPKVWQLFKKRLEESKRRIKEFDEAFKI